MKNWDRCQDKTWNVRIWIRNILNSAVNEEINSILTNGIGEKTSLTMDDIFLILETNYKYHKEEKPISIFIKNIVNTGFIIN